MRSFCRPSADNPKQATAGINQSRTANIGTAHCNPVKMIWLNSLHAVILWQRLIPLLLKK
ncbi:MAG: hypothetical protein CMJ19_10520 [Phycisphaeraceae bacterium]|nr:hypothetical protein [Phycisphaeraceae bacterium]